MKVLLLIILYLSAALIGNAQVLPKLIAEDIESSDKILTGVPFTAEAVTTSTQILADGTKINHTSRSKLYRDAAGRFRRDSSRQQLNIPGANVELQESILISDPVAGYRYSLNTNKRTYRQYESKETDENMPVITNSRNTRTGKSSTNTQSRSNATSSSSSSSDSSYSSNSTSTSSNQRLVEKSDTSTTPDAKGERKGVSSHVTSADGVNLKKELLGTRTIEGLSAEGTRTTAIIPAGAIGNDRPISIVYEKWFSREIMMTVLSKQIDPRFGEQEYKLTNISRTAPPLSVFSPPADYTREDGGKREPLNKKRSP